MIRKELTEEEKEFAKKEDNLRWAINFCYQYQQKHKDKFNEE